MPVAQARLRSLASVIAEVEAMLAELEEAETLLQKLGSRRAYVGFAGGIYIEVDRDEALEMIERRKRALRALLEKLKSEASRGQAGAG